VTLRKNLSARLTLLVAIALIAAAALAFDRDDRDEPYEHLYTRAVQRQRLRWLAYRVVSYAREHKRPAFNLDSVLVHLDSVRAAEFRHFMVDVWGTRVYYLWDETTFTLMAEGGRRFGRAWSSQITRPPNATAEEGFKAFIAVSRREDVREEYAWPPEARGRRNELGQFVRVAP
jgi:hypothetical protein